MKTELPLEVWTVFSEKLRRHFDKGRYERWLADLVLHSSDDDLWILGAPCEFTTSFLSSQYLTGIRAVLTEILGRAVEVRIEHRVRDGGWARDGSWAGPVPADGPVDAPFSAVPEDSVAVPEDSVAVPEDSAPSAGRALPPGDMNAMFPGALFPGGGSSGVMFPQRATPGASSHFARKHPGDELELDGLMVGPCNRTAFQAAVEVLESPGAHFNPLVIYGAAGVGKTHLLRGLFRRFKQSGRVRPRRDAECDGNPKIRALLDSIEVPSNLKVRCVTGEQFFQAYVHHVQDQALQKFRRIYRGLDVLILEDFQLLLQRKKTLIEFMHTFNALVDGGSQVIISCDVSPLEIEGLDPCLSSRLISGLAVRMEKPDFETRLRILRSRAGRLATDFSESILEYLAENLRASPRELLGALNHLDIHARIDPDPLDMDLARALLAERLRERERKLTLVRIMDLVSRHYALKPQDLLSKGRQSAVARARHVAMYLSRRYTNQSLSQIGAQYGGRRHSTVTSAVQKIERLLLERDMTIARDIQRLTEELLGG